MRMTNNLEKNKEMESLTKKNRKPQKINKRYKKERNEHFRLKNVIVEI